MKNRMNKLAGKMNSMMICAHAALTDRRGEGYVDTAVKILMAVVIGALVLAGLYALFGDVVMPTLTERIQEMFDYAVSHHERDFRSCGSRQICSRRF